MSWYAIYTKPKNEDLVAHRLRGTGIDVINPKLKSKKFQRNKFTEVIEPLFPCYLFAHFDSKYFRMLNYTRGIRYVVGKSNPIVVPEDIINPIKEQMTDGDVITVEHCRFEKGNRVLIKDGPFRDFYGIFERNTKSHERIVILLEAINYRVEIDRCQVKTM